MKSVIKSCINKTLLVLVFPPYSLYWLSCLLFRNMETSIAGWSQLLSLAPGISGAYLRRAFYHWAFPACGHDCFISFGTVFTSPKTRLGNKVYIGVNCCLGAVTLEDDVLLGSFVSVMNGSKQHGTDRVDIPIREQPGVWPRVTIGQDSWIGDHAVVMANVGQHCVIGAGSVVTKDIPDYAIVAGVPARVLRYRKKNTPDSCDQHTQTETSQSPDDGEDPCAA